MNIKIRKPICKSRFSFYFLFLYIKKYYNIFDYLKLEYYRQKYYNIFPI